MSRLSRGRLVRRKRPSREFLRSPIRVSAAMNSRSSWLLLAPLLTPPVPVITAPPCSLCPEGAHRFQWIRNLVPEFGISSSHVKVLSSPAEFYELLKVQIRTAQRRVVMASLYLGTGLLEQELVDCLEETLEESLQAKGSSNLRVSILLDYTRGSRVLMPERFNETIGLQHIKVYLFDDNVILSGANLSDLYFTNRQDRYVLLQDSPEIADFFTELVDAIGDVSLQLQRDDTVQMMEGMVHPYRGDKAAYCETANRRVMEVINSARTRQELLHAQAFHSSQPGSSLSSQQGSPASGGLKPEPDTWVYPLIQMKPFGIQIDEMVTETLLTEAERDARIYLTTGYFNLTQAYMDLVLGTRAEYRILLASPEVNGFFGAKGVAGAIPAAYVHIERQFYSELCCLRQQERVRLQEYSRAGWTFHAKENTQRHKAASAEGTNLPAKQCLSGSETGRSGAAGPGGRACRSGKSRGGPLGSARSSQLWFTGSSSCRALLTPKWDFVVWHRGAFPPGLPPPLGSGPVWSPVQRLSRELQTSTTREASFPGGM
ncbi:PREDICTED: CDP-diacylglycerol--glycerol-3-phosphate 3-phosphatidyltransferase, mitochondrial [Eurypyga helias]|uniref:CDP-diacylglycerol--glycerol-3-phosphate 3-phosphatidyltransferase, mitochondrial n=1 Tax=Eurypyga helias TaxID=54383 RepID=UPI00052891CB|nr:PREDICTED: CDP-diacylglycerol--glycerol-3-phosphate 3-phosphatidyltransferase, mitochondrial [Eurypyga helias]